MADDKKLLQEKKSNGIFKDEFKEKEDDMRMGLWSWRPEWLQRFNSIKWFMFALCLASLSQGIVVLGITVVSLPTIEKEFGISSKISGVIMAGNDVSALAFVTVVSFFGSKAHKPKWIAIGTLITGIGVAIFALPKVLIGDYEPINYKTMMSQSTTGSNTTLGMTSNPMTQMSLVIDMCQANKVKLPLSVDCGVTGGKILQIFVLFLGLFVMGAGTTPIQTLGPAFLDENVSPRASPIYLGIFFATTMLGPGLGFVTGSMFLRMFTNGDLPEGMEDLTPKDPRWIGAWWLSYVSLAGLFLLSSFMLFLFPKKLKQTDLKRESSIKNGQLPSEDITVKYTFKGYLKEVLKICRNKVFMLCTFGFTIRAIYIAGMVTFISKLLVLKFGVAPDKAGLFLGIMLMPSMIIGILCGSYIMRKIKVALAARTAAKICVIITVITAANSCIFLIPGCNNTNMAGVRVPYHNTTLDSTALSSTCNIDCKCNEAKYVPICGTDGVTYHSPCYAGCEVILIGKDKLPYFGNCTCIPPMLQQSAITNNKKTQLSNQLNQQNITTRPIPQQSFGDPQQSFGDPQQQKMYLLMQKMLQKASSLYNKATIGKCDRDCKNFYIFIVFTILSVIVSLLSGTPHKIMLLR